MLLSWVFFRIRLLYSEDRYLILNLSADEKFVE